jgi:hypothetical protein
MAHKQTKEEVHAHFCAVRNWRTALLFAACCALLVIVSWKTTGKAPSKHSYFDIPFNVLTILILGRWPVVFRCFRERFVLGLVLVSQVKWLVSWFVPTLGVAVLARQMFRVLWVLAFLMSLSMLVQSARNPYVEPEEGDTMKVKRGMLIMGAVIVTALLLSALLYFVPLR